VPRKKKKRRKRFDPMLLTMKAMLLMLLLTFIGGVVGTINWLRLLNAVNAAAVANIGNPPTVASILATRDAIRQTAKDHGNPRAVVLVVIERRTTDGGGMCHVACFYLCAEYCHPEFECTLPTVLTPADLEHLLRERIHEHIEPGQRWKVHRH